MHSDYDQNIIYILYYYDSAREDSIIYFVSHNYNQAKSIQQQSKISLSLSKLPLNTKINQDLDELEMEEVR